MRRALLWPLLAGLAALPFAGARAQGAITATPVEYTAFGPANDRALAEHWGLPEADVARYRQYMQVEGRYFYAHLDPVMVLGIIETDPAKRARFAERYLDAERRRVAAQTGFATLVAATQLERYGLESPVDFSRLPQAAHSPGYRAARSAREAPPGLAADRAPAAPPPAPAAATLRAGDTVDVWVEAGCEAPCHDKLTEILQTPDVKVHLYGRGFKDALALVAWLERWPAPGLDAAARAAAARRIEPRRFDPVIFGGIDLSQPPVALLRRNGAAIARF
jgi:hypothetical protein